MGKKGRQKFTDVWANQTNLGKQFGLSAVAMGKKLNGLLKNRLPMLRFTLQMALRQAYNR